MGRGVRDKKCVRDLGVRGQTALVRVDFNVPFKPGTTEISDDGRIRAALPTLRYLLERDCRLVVCSHLGRPKGQVVESLRMSPVSQRLSELLGVQVAQCAQVVGDEARSMASVLAAGDVMMLENTRFHPGEERNDPAFAQQLASLATLYINDAFGTAHRAHASTEGVARFLPSAAGLLMERELRFLGSALTMPRRPFAVILGGAKVSDKIGVLENLSGRADLLLIGGGMAATFIRAQGFGVGESAIEDDRMSFAHALLRRSDGGETKLLLPVDVVVADAFAEDATHCTVSTDAIPSGFRILDIGPKTARKFNEALQECKTVMWNGPQGVFEWEAFSHGTRAITETLAALDDATTVLGGGSTAEAVASLGLSDKMTHVSSGGGASLEFMEGKDLPGVAALPDK
ncbi:MAG: phosphoglycerate kinase [Chloroflexi bacterium]|nr:phosphoglycerate kinase [Chloroflexota bacterium]